VHRECCSECNGSGRDQDDLRSLRGKQKKMNEIGFDLNDVCGACEHCGGNGIEPDEEISTHNEGDDDDRTHRG